MRLLPADRGISREIGTKTYPHFSPKSIANELGRVLRNATGGRSCAMRTVDIRLFAGRERADALRQTQKLCVVRAGNAISLQRSETRFH